MKNLCLLFCLLGISILPIGTTYAEIYKSVDANGHITYSNIPSRGSTRLDLGFFTPSQQESKPSRAMQPKVNTPINFPKVDKQTQLQRDSKRKSILQTELDAESKALADSKSLLTENESSINSMKSGTGKSEEIRKLQEKQKSIQSDIENHQSNIQLLQKEINATK